MIGEVTQITQEDLNQRKIKVGFAPVKVLAVNPTKDELNRLTNWDVKEEPRYVGEKDGEKYAIISFLVESQDNSHTIASSRIFLSQGSYFNKDMTKVQIIDKYGRSAWAMVEDALEQKIPQYRNGPAKIATPYHKARRGEVQLVKFLADYLPIDEPDVWDDNLKKYVERKDIAKCAIVLEHIDDYFNGDFSELKEIVAKGEYPMKAYPWGLFCKRESNGNLYQDVFCGLVRPMRNPEKGFARLVKDFGGNELYSFSYIHDYDPMEVQQNPVGQQQTTNNINDMMGFGAMSKPAEPATMPQNNFEMPMTDDDFNDLPF